MRKAGGEKPGPAAWRMHARLAPPTPPAPPWAPVAWLVPGGRPACEAERMTQMNDVIVEFCMTARLPLGQRRMVTSAGPSRGSLKRRCSQRRARHSALTSSALQRRWQLRRGRRSCGTRKAQCSSLGACGRRPRKGARRRAMGAQRGVRVHERRRRLSSRMSLPERLSGTQSPPGPPYQQPAKPRFVGSRLATRTGSRCGAPRVTGRRYMPVTSSAERRRDAWPACRLSLFCRPPAPAPHRLRRCSAAA